MSLNFKEIGFTDDQLRQYIDSLTPPEDPLLAELFRDTWVNRYHPRQSSDARIGRFLSMLVTLLRPRRILEIGTYTAYGTLSLAGAMSADCELHTLETDEEIAEHAARWIARCPVHDRIHLHICDALLWLPETSLEFDLIFIDGDKHEYPAYYKAAKPKLSKTGVIIADNVLWSGKVAADQIDTSDKFTRGVAEFNQLVCDDPETGHLLLPLYDGIMLIWNH